MRIENQFSPEISGSQAREAQKVDQRGVEDLGKEAGIRRDETTLSEEARLLQRVRQAINEGPEVREDLIEALRQKIQAGTYQIDDEALINALLGGHQHEPTR
jgi:flagellar biosynthesis anti-sigma factor FlgM